MIYLFIILYLWSIRKPNSFLLHSKLSMFIVQLVRQGQTDAVVASQSFTSATWLLRANRLVPPAHFFPISHTQTCTMENYDRRIYMANGILLIYSRILNNYLTLYLLSVAPVTGHLSRSLFSTLLCLLRLLMLHASPINFLSGPPLFLLPGGSITAFQSPRSLNLSSAHGHIIVSPLRLCSQTDAV